MALGKGFEGILGVRKEGTYGTPLAVTEAIPFVSESFENEIEKHADEVLRGKAGAHGSRAGNLMYPFTVPCKLTYEDLDLLIALAMGSAGTPAVSGSLYSNLYSLAEDLNNSFCAAVYKGVSVWEYAGCKVDTLKIAGEANKPLDIEFAGAAKSLDLASEINTAGVVTALDTEDAAAKIMFADAEFKIAAQDDALATESAKGIGSFEFNLANNLAMDQFDNQALTILEPFRNGKRDVKFNFSVPRYEADTYLTWRDAETALHAYLKFSAGSYIFDIHFPRLIIDKVSAPITGPGMIAQSIECTAFRDPSSTSASFTTTEECEIAVVNGRSSSPLA